VDGRGDLIGTVIKHDPSYVGFAVTGVIRFSDDGTPAAGLTFIIFNPGSDLFLETDGHGRFTSEPMLQSGVTSFEHRVAEEPGLYQSPLRFAPASLTLDGEVGETKEVELTLLRPEAELDVLVVHRDDRPALGALVELQYRYEAHPGEFHGNTEVAFSKADGIASFSLYDLEQINAGNTAGMVAFLEVVDAASGERLDRVLLMIYRAPNLEDYSFQRTKEGLTSPYVADHPGTTIVFEHHGYRRISATLAELEKLVPVDGPRRVLLERGLLRTLHVEGNDENGESAPVAGAAVRLEGRLLGRTNEAGELTVDLHTWPEQGLTVEAEAFAHATWLPREGFADIEPAWVWLERE